MKTNSSIEPPTPQEIAQLILDHSKENKYEDPVKLLQGIACMEQVVVPAWGGEERFWIVYNSPNGL